MTELLALKGKWFIDLSLEDRFSPPDAAPGLESPALFRWKPGGTVDRRSGHHDRLRLLPSKRPAAEFPYRYFFNRIVDPYSGPERET
jgi:hypothetical protein